MKKILYLTYESLEKQPILYSQVLPLLNEICEKSEYEFDLVTFEDCNTGMQMPVLDNVNHIKFKKRIFFVNLIFTIFFLIKKGTKYDIYHVRSYFPMFFVLIYKIINPRIKIIFDMRGVMPYEFKLRARRRSIYIAYYYIMLFFERVFVKFSDINVVVSSKFKEYLESKYSMLESKIAIISTFSIERLMAQKKANITYPNVSNPLIFVYSGSMEEWQQFDKVCLLFLQIHKSIPKSRLLILTRDVDRAKNFLIGISEDLYHITTSSYLDLGSYIQQCDFGFLIRENDIVNNVAAPIKLNDYLSSGVKIILSSGIGDSEELIRKYNIGLVVSDSSEKGISKFVTENYDSLYCSYDKTIVRNTFYREFDINLCVHKYIKIYGNLLKAH